jgi:hypothetical protein
LVNRIQSVVAVFGLIAVIVALVRPAVVAVTITVLVPGALLFLTGARIGQDAEIMIRELQIIFGHDPIAGQLRVPCHVPVFFKQLRRIAACAAIDPVALIGVATTTAHATLGALIVVTTATAPVLTIIHRHSSFLEEK